MSFKQFFRTSSLHKASALAPRTWKNRNLSSPSSNNCILNFGNTCTMISIMKGVLVNSVRFKSYIVFSYSSTDHRLLRLSFSWTVCESLSYKKIPAFENSVLICNIGGSLWAFVSSSFMKFEISSTNPLCIFQKAMKFSSMLVFFWLV